MTCQATKSFARRFKSVEMKAIEICEDCGKTFEGGARAFICPECRKERNRQAAKKRNLNRLGLIAQGKNVKNRGDLDE